MQVEINGIKYVPAEPQKKVSFANITISEEPKGWEWSEDNIRISSTQRGFGGFGDYPLRLSILCNTERGRAMGKYGSNAGDLPGDVFTTSDARHVASAITKLCDLIEEAQKEGK